MPFSSHDILVNSSVDDLESEYARVKEELEICDKRLRHYNLSLPQRQKIWQNTDPREEAVEVRQVARWTLEQKKRDFFKNLHSTYNETLNDELAQCVEALDNRRKHSRNRRKQDKTAERRAANIKNVRRQMFHRLYQRKEEEEKLNEWDLEQIFKEARAKTAKMHAKTRGDHPKASKTMSVIQANAHDASSDHIRCYSVVTERDTLRPLTPPQEILTRPASSREDTAARMQRAGIFAGPKLAWASKPKVAAAPVSDKPPPGKSFLLTSRRMSRMGSVFDTIGTHQPPEPSSLAPPASAAPSTTPENSTPLPLPTPSGVSIPSLPIDVTEVEIDANLMPRPVDGKRAQSARMPTRPSSSRLRAERVVREHPQEHREAQA